MERFSKVVFKIISCSWQMFLFLLFALHQKALKLAALNFKPHKNYKYHVFLFFWSLVVGCWGLEGKGLRISYLDQSCVNLKSG